MPLPPVQVALNHDGSRWVAELCGLPVTRSFGRTLGEASERARHGEPAELGHPA